jgi:hypothetical protein
MALSISVKDEKAERIVTEAKIKAVKTRISLSEAVLKLLDHWNRGNISTSSPRTTCSTRSC